MALQHRADRRADGRLVLVVDDDLGIRGLVREVLEDAGFAVVTAADGRAALDRAAERWPDLVVLDLGLPRLDGEGVARGLRDTHTAVPPILIVSAANDIAVVAARVSAFAYLRKPFDLDELVATVHRGLDTDTATMSPATDS